MRTTRRRFLTLAGGALASVAVTPSLLRLTSQGAFAQAIPGSPAFTGNATTSVVGPVSLNAGVTVVRAQFEGATNFAAVLALPQPGAGPAGPYVTDSYLPIFNQTGAFKGAAVALPSVPGDYFLTTSAAGAFKLSVEQPLPETITPVQQTVFSGKGLDASPYFMLPDGISQISMQSTNPQQVATLYHLDDLGGEALVAGVQGFDTTHGSTLFDFRDPTNQGTFPLSLPDDGPYLLSVWNDINDQSTWTISFA